MKAVRAYFRELENGRCQAVTPEGRVLFESASPHEALGRYFFQERRGDVEPADYICPQNGFRVVTLRLP